MLFFSFQKGIQHFVCAAYFVCVCLWISTGLCEPKVHVLLEGARTTHTGTDTHTQKRTNKQTTNFGEHARLEGSKKNGKFNQLTRSNNGKRVC